MANTLEEQDAAMRGAASIITQLFAVEERAGVAGQANQARRLAVDAVERTDEEFADAKERSLVALRQIYFGVSDLAQRKELIRLRRESDRAMRNAGGAVAVANKRLAAQQRRAN